MPILVHSARELQALSDVCPVLPVPAVSVSVQNPVPPAQEQTRRCPIQCQTLLSTHRSYI